MSQLLVGGGDGSTRRWTCPFCLFLCDDLEVAIGPDDASPVLTAGACAPARAGLAQFGVAPSAASPQVDGAACDLQAAIDAAARLLAGSGQPLFGGLGTDIAGARALYRLACATGAISDAADGASLMHGLRAFQDRGSFTTTTAEVRNRADLIVFLNGLPSGAAADAFDRCGLGDALVAERHVAVLEPAAGGAAAALADLAGRSGITAESVALHGDLFSTVALLAGLVAGQAVRGAPPALAALAERLRSASYGVIVGETAKLPAHGALIVEAVNRLIGTLNQRTRAGALWLGGADGAGTVNQVFSWLSGLPLRSRAGPLGLEHEPVCFDAVRLLADGAVDSLLWISSFGAGGMPPATALPLVLLGHPNLSASAARQGSVFIPVSTPGIGSAGHLFRADAQVVLPLAPLYDDTLPTVADVLGRLAGAVDGLRLKAHV